VLVLLFGTADEESSEQPEGSLLNLALANGSENSTSTVTTVVQGPDGRFFIPVPGSNSGTGWLYLLEWPVDDAPVTIDRYIPGILQFGFAEAE